VVRVTLLGQPEGARGSRVRVDGDLQENLKFATQLAKGADKLTVPVRPESEDREIMS